MSDRPKIAILASGNGTTAEALIYATQNGVLNADVVLVVSNNENAGVLQKIERFNQQGLSIKTLVINGQTHPGEAGRGEQTPNESQAIYYEIKAIGADLVLLLGYMKKAVGPLLDLPMLNTHPGLLPATRAFHGQDVQKFVLEQKHEFSGQTLHKVTAEYDAGETITEHTIPVMSWDTVETLNAAVQAVEKANIGVDVEQFLKNL